MSLISAEGENEAVRAFLVLYGKGSCTSWHMARHLKSHGFDITPSWLEADTGLLSRKGAQDWLRLLFAAEDEQDGK